MLVRDRIRRELGSRNFAGQARIATLVVLAFIVVVVWCGCSRGPKVRAAADPMPAADPIVVSSVGYDEPTRVLVVTLSSGIVYEYYDVPYEVYLDFIDAPSLNIFFAAHIRSRYRYRPEVVATRLPRPYPRREFEPLFLSRPEYGRSWERGRGGFRNYPPGQVYREQMRRGQRRGLETHRHEGVGGRRGR